MPITRSRAPAYPQILLVLATIQVSHDLLPLGFNDLLEQLTELRETHLPLYYVIRMIEDTDEQPMKSYKGKIYRVLSPGAAVYVELAHTTIM